MNATETWTVGRLLTWTTDYLKKAGSHSPRLDAEVLLAHARGCQRIELYTAFDDEPTEETKTAFREMVRRRAEGTPVAYLVGYKEFYSTTFEVNPDVLIPRPETEHLVVEALDRAKQLAGRGMLQIADIGTGSGAIAVCVAKHLSQSHVTAVDISSAALEVARRNAEKHQLGPERIEFTVGDLLSSFSEEDQFDLILSNPPYVSDAEFEALEPTVRKFEPKSALVAADGGAALIAELIDQATRHVKPGGFLIFEFSPMLATRLGEIIGEAEAWDAPGITKDLAGHARIVTLKKK